VLSGRGLCDELITRPEESYRLCCLVVCDLETSRIGAPYVYDISSLKVTDLTLILLTWRKWWTPNNASKEQMGFNSGFKGLICRTVLYFRCFHLSFSLSNPFKLNPSIYNFRCARLFTVSLSLPTIFFWGGGECNSHQVGQGLLIHEVSRSQRCTTVGKTPLDEWSARRRDFYLTTHNNYNTQTSMLPAGFEPTISEDERPQTYVLDRPSTGTGYLSTLHSLKYRLIFTLKYQL